MEYKLRPTGFPSTFDVVVCGKVVGKIWRVMVGSSWSSSWSHNGTPGKAPKFSNYKKAALALIRAVKP